MSSAERKYILDSNLFIQGFRESAANLELQRFHSIFAPFEYMSAVVVQELKAGVRSSADRKILERMVLSPFVRRGRIVVPSARTWEESGDVLAELARKEGLEPGRITKSFGKDILLALSCRESGMVLVTKNVGDFERIARVAPFQFTEPWPNPKF
jgi:predicted nucleic acid-binding protein